MEEKNNTRPRTHTHTHISLSHTHLRSDFGDSGDESDVEKSAVFQIRSEPNQPHHTRTKHSQHATTWRKRINRCTGKANAKVCVCVCVGGGGGGGRGRGRGHIKTCSPAVSTDARNSPWGSYAIVLMLWSWPRSTDTWLVDIRLTTLITVALILAFTRNTPQHNITRRNQAQSVDHSRHTHAPQPTQSMKHLLSSDRECVATGRKGDGPHCTLRRSIITSSNGRQGLPLTVSCVTRVSFLISGNTWNVHADISSLPAANLVP